MYRERTRKTWHSAECYFYLFVLLRVMESFVNGQWKRMGSSMLIGNSCDKLRWINSFNWKLWVTKKNKGRSPFFSFWLSKRLSEPFSGTSFCLFIYFIDFYFFIYVFCSSTHLFIFALSPHPRPNCSPTVLTSPYCSPLPAIPRY